MTSIEFRGANGFNALLETAVEIHSMCYASIQLQIEILAHLKGQETSEVASYAFGIAEQNMNDLFVRLGATFGDIPIKLSPDLFRGKRGGGSNQ